MNIYSRLAQLARYQPQKIAVETTTRRALTYAELDLLVRRIAGRLRSAGVAAGDVVGLRLRETPEHVAASLAVLRLGATILPMDWRGTRAEFERIAAQFDPKAVLDDESPPLTWAPNFVHLGGIDDLEPDLDPPGAVSGNPFIYGLTSGTTGMPKAMPILHGHLFARCATRALEGIFAREDRFLATLPLSYAAGREHALCVLLAGATLVMFPSLFEPRELVDFVNRNGITALSLSPNSVRALIEARHGGSVAMPGLRAFVSTTGKLQPEERALVRQHVSARLIDYYGSTGTGMIAIIAEEKDGTDPTVVGRPAIGMEVQIVDEAGKPLADGESGRIRVRGPAVVTEVVGAAGDPDEGFRDGWYYPGDHGRFGKGGLLHLEGRAADLIKRGGLMVHAQEVEQALRRHAAVADAAVVGAPSARLGQEVVAFVVARLPATARELTAHCRQELAPFKVPARFEFVDTLPRNANGKVVKAKLLEG
jgi:acyl-coenzyme A synthetase/AMP-(fatty) acid ligase